MCGDAVVREWAHSLEFRLPVPPFHQPTRPAQCQMPIKIWHEAAQGGKRTGAEVAGIGRGEGFDARRDGLALGEIEGADRGLQEGDLAAVGFHESDRAIRMADCHNQARETAAATDVQPVAVRWREVRQLGAIGEVAFFQVGQRRRCDEVDRRVPFADQACVGRQSCFT
ncbi:hypothetical protein IX54_03620 [Paracoccus sanguinis]|uniref:Uncharacterized protein n=1 Tax=Paracoccus sanguinis TaxID=1545044 RepID=A0A099GIA9_9RHOB|nr:hypothetical protein IX54_03620 [Paracoccus sanguinis]KGJ22327.1 hypothetical protein IX56_08680 [Paracoccus sanguinis]